MIEVFIIEVVLLLQKGSGSLDSVRVGVILKVAEPDSPFRLPLELAAGL